METLSIGGKDRIMFTDVPDWFAMTFDGDKGLCPIVFKKDPKSGIITDNIWRTILSILLDRDIFENIPKFIKDIDIPYGIYTQKDSNEKVFVLDYKKWSITFTWDIWEWIQSRLKILFSDLDDYQKDVLYALLCNIYSNQIIRWTSQNLWFESFNKNVIN